MAVMISLGFFIAWTPYVAVSFWSMFHPHEQEHMTPLVTLLPCLFAKSSTVYNPFIYFFFQRASWRELLHRVRPPAEGAKLQGCTEFRGGAGEMTLG